MGCTVSSSQQVRPSGPHIIVGPVVGTVTGDTARVLLEVDADCEITPSTPDGQRLSEPQQLKAGAPKVLTLTGLEPGTPYAVQFEGAHPQPTATLARFTTPGKTPPAEALRIAAVSCNKVLWDRQGEPDVWEDLAKRCVSSHATCLNLPLIIPLGYLPEFTRIYLPNLLPIHSP